MNKKTLIILSILGLTIFTGIIFAKSQINWEEPFYMKAEFQRDGVYKIDKFHDEEITCYVITGYLLGYSGFSVNPSISCLKNN